MGTSAAVESALNITVIDDDKGMRDAIVAMLELDGYEGRGSPAQPRSSPQGR